MKKVLIIGNQGYLGSILSGYLQDRGYYCEGADIGFFKYGVLYSPQKVPMLDKEARTITEKDIKNFDVVVMLAGISNDPFGNLSYEEVYDPTRHYAIKIAQICKKLCVRYIFPSSCSVYGDGSDGSQLNENAPTNPLTPYSLNKLQIEEDLKLIEDCSHSFLSPNNFSGENKHSDIIIYSLRKTLPIRDGGVLKIKGYTKDDSIDLTNQVAKIYFSDFIYLFSRVVEYMVSQIGWPNIYSNSVEYLKNSIRAIVLNRKKLDDHKIVNSEKPSIMLSRYISNTKYLERTRNKLVEKIDNSSLNPVTKHILSIILAEQRADVPRKVR